MENVTDNSTSPEQSVTAEVAQIIDIYLPPVLIVTGVTCNILVVLVMHAPFFAHVSTSLYISFNACLDNLSLLIALPAHWLHVNFPEFIRRGEHSDIMCDMFNFIGWSTSDLGIVLTAAMTMERAFAIKFPLKASRICTRKKAKYVIVGLLLFVVVKDCHFIVKSKIVEDIHLPHLCELYLDDEGFRAYAEEYFPILHNVFLLISFMLIIVSNIIILRCVKLSGLFPAHHSDASINAPPTDGKLTSANQSTRGRSARGRGRQLTIMLISDSLTIIACTLPFALLNVLQPHITFSNGDVSHLVYAVTFYLLYVNRCANFFLYCLSGERFRLGLKGLCVRKLSNTMSIYSIRLGNGTIRRSSSDDTDKSRRYSLTQEQSQSGSLQ